MLPLKEDITEAQNPKAFARVVKRLGTPESTTLLHSPYCYFQAPHIDGVIAYQQSGNCVVVVGDPLCLPQDAAELTKAFHFHCQKNNLKIVYFLVYQEFAHWAISNGCHTLIQVGEELSINPIQFQKKRKLRWHVNQSLKKGVSVKEYKNFDSALENQMNTTIHTWLKQRRGPQIHLGNVPLFTNSLHRVFYAQHEDKIVGLLMIFPLDRFQGWVVSSYLAISEAPVGTSEHLICSAIDALAQDNCSFLCLGVVPGSKLGETIGTGPLATALAHLIFKTANWLFKLNAKSLYFKKFHPRFRPTFILCKDRLTFKELFAMKHILNVKL